MEYEIGKFETRKFVTMNCLSEKRARSRSSCPMPRSELFPFGWMPTAYVVKP
jgi:hypothetical protein